jgi:phosphopentomutase/2,3-bisphosphoglycerate-independent phosphoglycerate mutase family metalloenzyme
MQKHRPVMLVVLDGWGWREDLADNAVRQAHKPNFDRLWSICPHPKADGGIRPLGESPPGHSSIPAPPRCKKHRRNFAPGQTRPVLRYLWSR